MLWTLSLNLFRIRLPSTLQSADFTGVLFRRPYPDLICAVWFFLEVIFMYATFESSVFKSWCCALAVCLTIFWCLTPVFANDSITVLSPYEAHGTLAVTGGNLTDGYGEAFQLRGVSTAVLSNASDLPSDDLLLALRDSWNVNTVRFSISANGNSDRRNELIQAISDRVRSAADLGLYLIISWQIDPASTDAPDSDAARSFFSDISAALSDSDNILYEIAAADSSNSWDTASSFFTDLIDTIRANVPNSVILVPVSKPDTLLEAAVSSPLNRGNLLYSLQAAAGDPSDSQLQTAAYAAGCGLPLIVSSLSLCDSSGQSDPVPDAGDRWLSMLSYYQIGFLAGTLAENDADSILLNPGASTAALADRSGLTTFGQWLVSRLNNEQVLPMFEPSSIQPSSAAASAPSESWSLPNGLQVFTSLDNSWSTDTAQWAEYTVTISNPTQTPVSSWRLRSTWCTDISFESYWSCDIGGSGSSWLLVPMNYVSVIPAGSSISFGFVCYGATLPSLIDLTLE